MALNFIQVSLIRKSLICLGPSVVSNHLTFLFSTAGISWVGIAQSVQRLATGWTVRGSNPAWGRDFPHPSKSALEPNQPAVQWVLGLFSGGKTVKAWR
jgi:hypothetical protein